jgi:hypothetical protein
MHTPPLMILSQQILLLAGLDDFIGALVIKIYHEQYFTAHETGWNYFLDKMILLVIKKIA